MNMITHGKSTLLLMLYSICTCLILSSGCESSQNSGSATANPQKIRLIANENLELKSQIKALEQNLEQQQDLLEQCNKEKAQATESAVDLNENILKMLQELTKENQRLQKENAELKLN